MSTMPLVRRLRRRSRIEPWRWLAAKFIVCALICVTAIASMVFPASAELEERRPLIFVPGIFGSKLCRDGDSQQLLWGSLAALTRFSELKLREDGRTSDFRIEPCGVVDELVYFGPIGQDIYGNFLGALEREGYEPNKTLFIFAYDWRLSNLDNADKLREKIEFFARQANIGPDVKFDIVAHSMGGLLTMVLANSGYPRIGRVITVSTPYKGSVKLMTSLEKGWGWLQRRLVSMKAVRETVLSFPSIYELIPSYRNCCAFGSGMPGSPVVLTKADSFRRLAWSRDVAPAVLNIRLENAQRLRDILSRQPSIPIARMYGIHEDTAEQVYLADGANAGSDHVIQKLVSSWQGDGTVMDYSATYENDLLRLPGGVAHEQIMSDARIIRQITGALRGNVPPKQIAGTLANCQISDGRILDIDGATLSGEERIVDPGQEVMVSFSIRTSSPLREPTDLLSVSIQGKLVTASGTTELTFAPIGTPRYEAERTNDGPDNFYVAKFSASFPAPAGSGDAVVEARCLPERDAMAIWNFKVAQ